LLLISLAPLAQAHRLLHEVKETGLMVLRSQIVVYGSLRPWGSIRLLNLVVVVLLVIGTSTRPSLVLRRSRPVGLAIGGAFVLCPSSVVLVVASALDV